MNQIVSRQLRRCINTKLRKLLQSDKCSICGKPFPHNSRTTGGLDTAGKVVLACEGCAGKVAATFAQGLYSARQIDFPRPNTEAHGNPTAAQISEAIGLFQNVIRETDKVLDDAMRCGGDVPVNSSLNLLDDCPWKNDDRDWFERHPNRAHRLRLPFAGEVRALDVPPEQTLVVVVRQVAPGLRLRPPVLISTNLLPLPDDEATAHGLFEVATGREAMPAGSEAFNNLVQKYSMGRSQ